MDSNLRDPCQCLHGLDTSHKNQNSAEGSRDLFLGLTKDEESTKNRVGQVPTKTLKNVFTKKYPTILIHIFQISENCQQIYKEADETLKTQTKEATNHQDPKAI